MKIVFLISTYRKNNPGIGGHYYSLIETCKTLSKFHNVSIINIGIKKAKSFDKIDIKLYNVITNKKYKFYNFYFKTKKIIEKIQPEVIQSFDIESFFWGRTIGKKLNIYHGITKCGGINPLYFPMAANLILFSKENLFFFKQKNKFKNSNIRLISNRINFFKDDTKRIEKLKRIINYNNNFFYLLRIVRIGSYYHKSSISAINLINKLNNDGIKSKLIFVGSIEDKRYLNELKNLDNGHCKFITEKEFHKNTKELISFSNAVIGTGRSLMEACSKSKILLFPAKNLKYPVVLDKNTFETGFHYNFSERTIIEFLDDDDNYSKLKEIITNNRKRGKYKYFSNEVFKKHFDANFLFQKYNEYFSNMKEFENIYFDYFLHFLFILRKYILNK